MNDLLSFHKEELAGEKYNLVHLQTQSFHSLNAGKGSGPDGEWTTIDTIRVLCGEVREAVHRVDALLQVDNATSEDCELGLGDDERAVDIAIARQWKAFRDGYISWHFECQRYKLDFLRSEFCF
jgi:hypothetical protein